MILDWLYGGGGNAATVETLGHPAAGVIGWTGPTGTSGVHVTPDTALGWSGVWAAQNKISGALASLPGKVSQKVGATRNDATEHSLYPVVHDEPNEDMDSFVFWEMMHNWWVGRGNAFAEKELNGAGEVLGLWPIHPTRVRVYEPKGGARRWLVLGNQGSPSVTIPWEDMLNIVGPLSDDGIIGRGVIDQALESIGVAIATERYMGAFYGNGAKPAGLLEHPGRLSDEARKNIRKEWNQIHQGPDNAGKIAILWEGMKYHMTGTDPEHAKLIEAAQFRITDMARWYDLPPHVLADLTRSTFCLPADVEVYTAAGPKRICDVAAGEFVWSHSEQGLVRSKVVRSACSGSDEILSIRTTNRTLRANARHRVLVRRRHHAPRAGYGGYQCREWRTEWIPAGDLRVGDTLVTLDRLPETKCRQAPTREATVEFMEFCGLLLGDGNLMKASGRYVGVQIARAANAPYMDHYRQSMRLLFKSAGPDAAKGERHGMARLSKAQADSIRTRVGCGENSGIVAGEYGVCRSTVQKIAKGTLWGGGQPRVLRPVNLYEGERQTCFKSEIAAQELVECGLSGTARTKRVPAWVFGLDDELKLAFLRGFLDADGSVDKKGRASFSSCNEVMLSQVRHLCMGLGIPVTNLRCQEGVTTLPNGARQAFRQFGFTCSDPGANRQIGSHTPHYIERMETGKPFCRKGRAYPDWGGDGFDLPGCSLARIVSIETNPAEPVYDLEVEGTHSFIANGVVVHNSNIDSQQISLVVDSYRTRIIRVEKSLRRQLFTQRDKDRGFFVRFVLDGLLRGDPKMRAETSAIKLRHGAFTINDWLAQEDMNPIGPEGDKRFIEANMTTIDKVGEQTPGSAAVFEEIRSVGTRQDAGFKEMKEGFGKASVNATEGTASLSVQIDQVNHDIRGEIAAERLAAQEAQADSTAKVIKHVDALGTCMNVHETADQGRHQANIVEHRKTQASSEKQLGIELASQALLRDLRIATRRTVEEVFALMLRKEMEGAVRVAKNSNKCLDAIESFYQGHLPRMVVALRAPLSAWLVAMGRTDEPEKLAMRIATVHCEQSKELLLTATECQPAELEQSISACVAEWPKRTIDPEQGE